MKTDEFCRYAMSGKMKKRVAKDIDEVAEGRNETFALTMVESEPILKLRGWLTGPAGTVYEGRKLRMEAALMVNYPFEPPKVNCTAQPSPIPACFTVKQNTKV